MKDAAALACFIGFVLCFGFSLQASQASPMHREDCPGSHVVTVNGAVVDCTNTPTNDRGGYYRGIEKQDRQELK